MKSIIYICIGLLILAGCNPIPEIISDSGSHLTPNFGSIQLSFPIDDSKVPQRCVRRADLSIAFTADSLYRKEFVTVTNVSDYQSLYEISLRPGTYYYQAAKTCICGGDTCLWGGYSGGQNGMKWTMSQFSIIRNEITTDLITFD